MQTRKMPPIRRASAEVSPIVPPYSQGTWTADSPALLLLLRRAVSHRIQYPRGVRLRGSEVCHMTREGNQKETSSCKRRVHDVLAKTAEKLFYNENCKHTTDHRHPKRCLHRHVHCQQKTSYQCTAVGNRHRFLHSFFIQIFRQGTDCHRNQQSKAVPEGRNSRLPRRLRGKGKQDGKHDFVCRHLGPRVWGR